MPLFTSAMGNATLRKNVTDCTPKQALLKKHRTRDFMFFPHRQNSSGLTSGLESCRIEDEDFDGLYLLRPLSVSASDDLTFLQLMKTFLNSFSFCFLFFYSVHVFFFQTCTTNCLVNYCRTTLRGLKKTKQYVFLLYFMFSFFLESVETNDNTITSVCRI